MTPAPLPIPASRYQIAAWLLMATGLLLTLKLHLLPSLLAGLLMVQVVHLLAPRIVIGRLSHTWAKVLVVSLITLIVLGVLGGFTAGVILYLRGEGGVAGLLGRMAEIIENSRALLPPWAAAWLPQGDDSTIRAGLVEWLRVHALEIRQYSGNAGRALLHFIIGLIIGSFIALREATPHMTLAPLALAMCERVHRLGDAFRRVVFAQIRISALNALLTAIYLFAVLPAFGVQLPFTKTMIVVTFLVGLLPVIGNLISNTVIVIISLSHSLQVAGGSLAFLIIIHKLEYFVNARIIGEQIKARAWELLIAMLVMEAAFGLQGVIAAPIIYAYIKKELSDKELI
ncbi:AI-2E family transporter [Thiobacillus sp.]|uniref:AI-2E family transporter n=1 Tax=Thiobacillus sp. TaxID=924 RepID=UPI00286D7EB1|nr:AI-2E family transporter [Thiobacillus sp.]